MSNEGIFRLVFLVLLVMLLAMRVFFMWKVHQAGERILPGKEAVAREGGQLVLLVRVIIFLLLIAFLVAYFAGMAWIEALSFVLPDWLRWSGAVLGLLGVIFWTWTQVELDLRFSAQLQLSRDHQLVVTGPYARLRHPLYTAMCGWAVAIVLLSANWLFVGMAALSILGVLRRVPREEAMLLEAFGEQYRLYMQHTGSLLPRLGKIKP